MTISASDDSLLAGIKPLKEAIVGDREGIGPKAAKGGPRVGRVLKDITNMVGQASGKNIDETVTLPSDVNMEAWPMEAQVKTGNNSVNGPPGTGYGGIDAVPINGRPSEIIMVAKDGVTFEVRASAISTEGERKRSDDEEETEIESESFDWRRNSSVDASN